jgi:hypothetical protein
VWGVGGWVGEWGLGLAVALSGIQTQDLCPVWCILRSIPKRATTCSEQPKKPTTPPPPGHKKKPNIMKFTFGLGES